MTKIRYVFPSFASVYTKLSTLISTAIGQGASIIGIHDSGSKYTSTTVEGALDEIATTTDGLNFNKLNIDQTTPQTTVGTFIFPKVATPEIKTDTTTPTDLTITTGTAKTLLLATTIYEDVNASISSGRVSAANAPAWTAFLGNLSEYTFDVNDYINLGTVEIPHSYKEGTNFEIHVHWATNGVDGTNRYVKWEVEYSVQNDTYSSGIGVPFNTPTVISAETMIPANTADRSGGYTSIGTVTGTGIKIGAMVKMRLRRIAASSTAPTANPFAMQVGIHFSKDTMGSRNQITK